MAPGSARSTQRRPYQPAPDPAQARPPLPRRHQALQVLHRRTLREVNTNQYVDLLATEAHNHLGANGLIPPGSKGLFIQPLILWWLGLSPAAVCGQPPPHRAGPWGFSTGQYPGRSGSAWLIDWEYSGRRQAAYDILTFRLESRFTRGLAGRLQNLIAQGNPDSGTGAGFFLAMPTVARFPAPLIIRVSVSAGRNGFAPGRK